MIKKIIIGAFSLIFISALGGFLYFFLVPPEVIGVIPKNKTEGVKVDSEIRVDFSRPVNRDSLIPTIKPSIPGEWSYENHFLEKHLFRSLVFKPEHVLMPETKYKIDLKGIKTVTQIGEAQNYFFSFSTQTIPKVDSVSPKNKTENISPAKNIKVKLTEQNPDIVDFDFILSPKVKLNAKLNKEKDEYTLTPKSDLAQGIKYNLKIIGTFVAKDKKTKKVVFQGESKELYKGCFKTAPPPKIASFFPTGGNILEDSKIKITFADPMDKESVEDNFSIYPLVKGSFIWTDNNKSLTFGPAEPLALATTFSATIKKGTKDSKGGYFSEDSGFSFSTIGRVGASFYPQSGTTGFGVGNSIKIYFNQAIDKVSAKSKFSISPKVDGGLYFDGNTMIFDPAKTLGYQKIYKATVSSGVKSIHGLDSNQRFSTSFTTQSQTVKLAVPMDFQDRPLSCEAAALKMALAHKGIFVSEGQIMNYIKTNHSSRQGDVWGDPYIEYVGNIDGSQNTTGYGVYWGPIATAARAWRPNSAVFSGWGTADLTKELKNGNPVVVWGVIGGAYHDPWHTGSGKYINAWKGEHARTAIGYIGSQSSPSTIILNDPWAGQIYLSTSAFVSNWNTFGRSGVVVR